MFLPSKSLESTLESTQARKIYLKDDLETRCKVLHQIHNSPIGGHPGISNTWDLVRRQYQGPKLRQFVESYVKGCAICQETKVITHMKRAPLYHFDTSVQSGPFQFISIDLITDLPLSNGKDTILTIVDQGCSKAAKFIACNKSIDGQGVANLYCTSNIYSPGLDYQEELFLTATLDLQAALLRLFVKQLTYNRTLVLHSTLEPMVKLKE